MPKKHKPERSNAMFTWLRRLLGIRTARERAWDSMCEEGRQVMYRISREARFSTDPIGITPESWDAVHAYMHSRELMIIPANPDGIELFGLRVYKLR